MNEGQIYNPKPIDVSKILLPIKLMALTEKLAENVHEIWAIQRLKDGDCTPEVSFMFSDLLADFRRIAAHCGNIAISVIQLKDTKIGKHEYNHRNKEDDSEYNSKYKDYKSRYNVPKVEV